MIGNQGEMGMLKDCSRNFCGRDFLDAKLFPSDGHQ